MKMPIDYANMQLYKHSLKATEPSTGKEVTGTLDPNKRYTLDFLTAPISRENVTPKQVEEATNEDVAFNQREVMRQNAFPEVAYDEVDDLAQEDYKTGQLDAQNQFLEDKKIINELPPGSQENLVLSQWAEQKFRAKVAELESKKQQWDNVRRRLREDPKYNYQTRNDLELNYYSKNPIFETRRSQIPEQFMPKTTKEPFTLGHIQSALGKLATDTVKIYNADSANAIASDLLGIDYAQNYPEAVAIINERQRKGWLNPLQINQPMPTATPTTTPIGGGTTTEQPVVQRQSLIEKYKALGGSRTPEGRAFGLKYL